MRHDGFYLYEAGDFGERCAAVCIAAGLPRWPEPDGTLLAIAPLLTRKLPGAVWSLPLYGTLIFHPSALPYGRGPDAIRWAHARGERVSAATWFWCDDDLDAGPVCEQEPVLLDLRARPGANYRDRFIPAGLRALERAIAGVGTGKPRAVPQEQGLATYDGLHRAKGHVCPHCGRPTAPLAYHEGPEDCLASSGPGRSAC